MNRQKWLAGVTAVLILAVPGVLLVWGFLLPPRYDGSFLGELKYKLERLEETEGPRLVLVGGSALAFGVDSVGLEEELPDYHVVNLGMYAALGTTVMLDLTEPLIRPGDLVILAPEQQAQTLSDFFDASVLWQGLDGAFHLLGTLPPEKLERLAGCFPRFAAEKAAWLPSQETPEGQGVYTRESFNAWGDVASPLCIRNVMPGGFDPDIPIRFDPELLTPEFRARVRSYAKALTQRGATVCWAFCPMNAQALQGEAAPEDFYQALLEALDFPILGNPRDSILDPGWFYDTNFHLNNSGKLLYTRVLLDGIKAFLGDSSPTRIPLPQLPGLEMEEVWRGDDRDGACFQFEAWGDGLRVVGLTELALGREVLTVPSTWEGRGVYGIGQGAFAGTQVLREIHIQRGVKAIADGAFRDCPSLRRIVLDQPRPSACQVGPSLLEGSSADVFVPGDTLSAYRTDYFWSVLGTRVRAE